MAMVRESVDMATETTPEIARGTQGSRGAQFALQVALQTMKERCQQLQRRLATLEDENISLRRQMARSGTDERSTSGPDSLREQVAVLSLQKAQLSQQMQMVAAENRQLWLRLSRLYQANQSLGSHLSRISDTLKQHSATSPTPQGQGDGDASLEEISLRLANSIMQEKMDLEQQCAQMAEMQENGGASSPLDLQTLAAEGDGSETLAAHYRRLAEVRDLLRGHQSTLRAGIAALRNVEQRRHSITLVEGVAAEAHQPVNTDEEELRQISSLREWGEAASHPRHSAAIQDWTCPMCGKYFPITSVQFDVFHAHVTAHFVPDEEEDDPAHTFEFCD